MEQQTKPTEKSNVQRRCEEIHAQYGTSEMANYRIQQMRKITQNAFDEALDFIVEREREQDREQDNDYICDMLNDISEETDICAEGCKGINKTCVRRFLERRKKGEIHN